MNFWQLTGCFNKKRTPRRNHTSHFGFERLQKRELLAADVVGTYFDVPEEIHWGETIQVNSIVENDGNRDAPQSWAQVMLSTNSTISNYDQHLGWLRVQEINDGENLWVSGDVTLPTSPPRRFDWNDRVTVGMMLDYFDQVDESYRGERNNRNEGNGEDRDRVNISQVNTSTDSNDQINEAIYLGTVGRNLVHPLGTIDAQDVDMFGFRVQSGQRISIDVDRQNGEFDSVIRLFDGQGNQIGYNDDRAAPDESWHNWESHIEYTFNQAGVYYVGVSGYGNRNYDPLLGTGDGNGRQGDYSLTISVSMVPVHSTMTRGNFYDYLTHVSSGGYGSNDYYARGVNPLANSNASTNRGSQYLHNGIDLQPTTNDPRDTHLVAPESGRITRATWTNANGYEIYLAGDSGLIHRFIHLDQNDFNRITSTGIRIRAGQHLGRLARIGEGGVNQHNIPHLHYTVLYNGFYVDPAVFFPTQNIR